MSLFELAYLSVPTYFLFFTHRSDRHWQSFVKPFLDWANLRIENVPDDDFKARYGVYEANREVQIQIEIWNKWVGLKGALLADLLQERAMINHTKSLQDDEGKFVHSGGAEQKEAMNKAS
jgi:hypothetical protein